jgi:hypothetical protein
MSRMKWFCAIVAVLIAINVAHGYSPPQPTSGAPAVVFAVDIGAPTPTSPPPQFAFAIYDRDDSAMELPAVARTHFNSTGGATYADMTARVTGGALNRTDEAIGFGDNPTVPSPGIDVNARRDGEHRARDASHKAAAATMRAMPDELC